LTQADAALLVPSIAMGTFRQQLAWAKNEQQHSLKELNNDPRPAPLQLVGSITPMSSPLSSPAIQTMQPSFPLPVQTSNSGGSLMGSVSGSNSENPINTVNRAGTSKEVTTEVETVALKSDKSVEDEWSNQEKKDRAESFVSHASITSSGSSEKIGSASALPPSPLFSPLSPDIAQDNLYVIDANEFITALVDVIRRMTSPSGISIHSAKKKLKKN